MCPVAIVMDSKGLNAWITSFNAIWEVIFKVIIWMGFLPLFSITLL